MKAIQTARLMGAAILCLLATVVTAFAQSPLCGTFADLERQLQDEYGERQLCVGSQSNVMQVIVFAAVDGSTWTVIRRDPYGRDCMIASGLGWGDAAIPLSGTEG